MKETKRRLVMDKEGMVTALHWVGNDWVITWVPVEFAERVLAEGDAKTKELWSFNTEEYTE